MRLYEILEEDSINEGPIWDKVKAGAGAIGRGLGAVGQTVGAVAGIPAGIAGAVKQGYNNTAQNIAGGPIPAQQRPQQQGGFGGATTTSRGPVTAPGGGNIPGPGNTSGASQKPMGVGQLVSALNSLSPAQKQTAFQQLKVAPIQPGNSPGAIRQNKQNAAAQVAQQQMNAPKPAAPAGTPASTNPYAAPGAATPTLAGKLPTNVPTAVPATPAAATTPAPTTTTPPAVPAKPTGTAMPLKPFSVSQAMAPQPKPQTPGFLQTKYNGGKTNESVVFYSKFLGKNI